MAGVAAGASTRSPGGSRASPASTALFCAPGNAGIAAVAELVAVDPGDPEALLAFAERERDRSHRRRSRAAARSRHRRSLSRRGPPHLRSAARRGAARVQQGVREGLHGAPRHSDGALSRLRRRPPRRATRSRSGEFGFPVVLKADGLAAGKGVVVAADRDGGRAARSAPRWKSGSSAPPARGWCIEECLVGPEVSFFALCDGTRAIPIASAQDHKRIFDGDQGPNTGGMGAFAPSPLLDAALQARVMREIVDPVLRGHARGGHRVPRIPLRRPDADLRRAEGDRVQRPVRRSRSAGGDAARSTASCCRCWRPRPTATSAIGASTLTPGVSVGVVLASAGYPGTVTDRRADRRPAIAASQLPGVTVFHSGTALARRAASSPPAAACSPSSAPARTYRGRDRPRVRGRCQRSRSTACNTAATSAARQSAAATRQSSQEDRSSGEILNVS